MHRNSRQTIAPTVSHRVRLEKKNSCILKLAYLLVPAIHTASIFAELNTDVSQKETEVKLSKKFTRTL